MTALNDVSNMEWPAGKIMRAKEGWMEAGDISMDIRFGGFRWERDRQTDR